MFLPVTFSESTKAAYVTSAKARAAPPPIELPATQITSTEESTTSEFGAPVCWYRELRSVGLSDQIREVSPR
jgi:hypothetical protein